MTENTKIAVSVAAIGCAIAVIASPTFAVAAPLSAHIELGDHGFDFKSIGSRASSVRLTITNQGGKPHALAVSKSGSSQSAIAETKTLLPGQTSNLVLSMQPGNYRLFSPVDHDSSHGLVAPMKMMAPTLPDGAEMDRVFYNYR